MHWCNPTGLRLPLDNFTHHTLPSQTTTTATESRQTTPTLGFFFLFLKRLILSLSALLWCTVYEDEKPLCECTGRQAAAAACCRFLWRLLEVHTLKTGNNKRRSLWAGYLLRPGRKRLEMDSYACFTQTTTANNTHVYKHTHAYTHTNTQISKL